ncbi:dUMP phosphatase [compost metagenome]
MQTITVHNTVKDVTTLALYKHYSFDLWLTLIKSHPEFKHKRSVYFQQQFNPLNKSLEEVQHIFRRVDLMCNAINEKTGGNIRAEEMYLMVLHDLYEGNTFFDVDMDALYQTVEEMIMHNLPQLYATDTIEALQLLKSRGSKINLLSNTGFIKGVTLRKILAAIGMDGIFDFELYSDETGCSKPNPQMFEQVFTQAQIYHDKIDKPEILHIGDNVLADIQGAKTFGFNTFHVHGR